MDFNTFDTLPGRDRVPQQPDPPERRPPAAACASPSYAGPPRPPAPLADAADVELDEHRHGAVDPAIGGARCRTTTEQGIMDGVAVHTTSRTLVGRDAELTEIASLLGVRSSADADGRAAPSRSHVVLSGDAGVGKTRLLVELRDLAFERGLAGGRRALPGLRRQRAALPPVLRGARPARGRAARGRRARRRRAPRAGPAPARPPRDGRDRERRRSDRAEVEMPRPGRPLRGRARPAGGGRRDVPGAAGHRGLPLGRPVDPRPAQLPVLPAVRRRRWPSSRRTAPTTCTAATRSAARSPSGRGCAASSGCSSGPLGRRPGPRCSIASLSPGAIAREGAERDRAPRRGQRVLRRGAGRRRRRAGQLGARRPRRRAAGPPRPARRRRPAGGPAGQRRRPQGRPRPARRGVRAPGRRARRGPAHRRSR